jgi:hypothetical protein
MGKYCQIEDFTDSLVSGNVTDDVLSKVDNYIDSLLGQIGVDPSSINPSDYPVLKELAVYFGSYLTCLELTSGENDVYLSKSKSYKELYEKMEQRILSYGLKLQNSSSVVPFTIKLSRG